MGEEVKSTVSLVEEYAPKFCKDNPQFKDNPVEALTGGQELVDMAKAEALIDELCALPMVSSSPSSLEEAERADAAALCRVVAGYHLDGKIEIAGEDYRVKFV